MYHLAESHDGVEDTLHELAGVSIDSVARVRCPRRAVYSPARQRLPPAHPGYMDTGTDDDTTLTANRGRLQSRDRHACGAATPDSATPVTDR